MGIFDIYYSLPEEQRRKIGECPSASSILALIKAENIPLTGDDLESLYMILYSNQHNNIIETGSYFILSLRMPGQSSSGKHGKMNEKSTENRAFSRILFHESG